MKKQAIYCIVLCVYSSAVSMDKYDPNNPDNITRIQNRLRQEERARRRAACRRQGYIPSIPTEEERKRARAAAKALLLPRWKRNIVHQQQRK